MLLPLVWSAQAWKEGQTKFLQLKAPWMLHFAVKEHFKPIFSLHTAPCILDTAHCILACEVHTAHTANAFPWQCDGFAPAYIWSFAILAIYFSLSFHTSHFTLHTEFCLLTNKRRIFCFSQKYCTLYNSQGFHENLFTWIKNALTESRIQTKSD